MSHTFSKTWQSDLTKQLESWAKVSRSMKRISPNSPFTPKSFKESVAQQIAYNKIELEVTSRRIDALKHRNGCPLNDILMGKDIADHLSLVLAKETIWVPVNRYQPGWLLAIWPTSDELRLNGDDANKSRHLRFLPTPRYPGNTNTNWKLRKEVPQRDFDRVACRTNIYYEDDTQYCMEEMGELLGHGLLAELDA